MSITREQLVEGGEYTYGDYNTINGVTVIGLGLQRVAVRHANGEVSSWSIEGALRDWWLPKPAKPEWLESHWVNVYPRNAIHYLDNTAMVDSGAADDRIGRVCIGTGEWVPCKGTEVLA